MFCNCPRSTGPVSKQKPLTVRKRSGASKTRYHPASAGFPALGAADNGAGRFPLLQVRRKRSGASPPVLPRRLTPAAGSLQAGITGFLPISASNSVHFKRVFPLCQGLSPTSQLFSASGALFSTDCSSSSAETPKSFASASRLEVLGSAVPVSHLLTACRLTPRDSATNS